MFDIKHETELYIGKPIDIDKLIDQTQSEAKANGQKIDDIYIKQIKKDFHWENKKRKHRTTWFLQCTELGIPYSTIEADMYFDIMRAKPARGGNPDIDLPIPIIVGTTVSLCGLFLVFIPLPFCQNAGFWLINTGFGIYSSHGLQNWDKYDREQKSKK